MLRRSLFACALMLAGVVGFASSAKAADATSGVDFVATVPSNCSFGPTVTSGTLDLNPTGNMLGSEFGAGTSGSVNLTCTGAANVAVNTPVVNTAPPGSPTTAEAKLTINTDVMDYGSSTPISLSAATTNVPAKVDMRVGTGSFPAGVYNYTVTVTATPQ